MGFNPWSLWLLVYASEQVELSSGADEDRDIREVAFAESGALRDLLSADQLGARGLGKLGDVPGETDGRADVGVDPPGRRDDEVEAQLCPVGKCRVPIRLLREDPLVAVL